jgi:hypothetical protein
MPDEDQLFLHPVDPPVLGRARRDHSAILDDMDFIKVQLTRLPTRNEVWRAAMFGMLGGAVAAVTLIEAFARACN